MFELPVLAFFVARVGLIDHRFLLRHSGYAVVLLALLAAVLTPPDFISQSAPDGAAVACSMPSASARPTPRACRMNRLERDAK